MLLLAIFDCCNPFLDTLEADVLEKFIAQLEDDPDGAEDDGDDGKGDDQEDGGEEDTFSEVIENMED